jgi:hypothetical protein
MYTKISLLVQLTSGCKASAGCRFFFIETQQAFGASTAVAAFDRLGSTVLALAVAQSGIPRKWVHRTLDDVPVVTPEAAVEGPMFAEKYKLICKDLNIQLAAMCPDKEKAFEDSTCGTVLGIRFNTTDLTCAVSADKSDNILRDVAGPLWGDQLTLEQLQHLMGVLNDFGQMCPFLCTGSRIGTPI